MEAMKNARGREGQNPEVAISKEWALSMGLSVL
jgi:hypothetical protein